MIRKQIIKFFSVEKNGSTLLKRNRTFSELFKSVKLEYSIV